MFILGFIFLLISIDLSASQRKLSRNVAVGADVKTVINFDCPEEFGYYPHPNDCTQYYVCVFGGALLESCTGGLMYSHELQTCDWPRNVGCDGQSGVSVAAATTPTNSVSRTREEIRTSRHQTPPTPPPASPSAIVTSRGQPRQLHHNQQEIIKQRQQQQLYAEAEESLPPAEEVENDRQQRVYRGQPSTLGQVQRDRDGLRHSNAISSYSGLGEKVSVISFGTQQQQQHQQPPYSIKTIDDNLLTNDLTLKRRFKRQIQRSHHHGLETWRTSPTKNNRITPLTLQPPPIQKLTNFYQKHDQNTYQISENEEFQPFFPQYKQYPSHTIANKESFTTIQNNYQHFPTSSTSIFPNNYENINLGEIVTSQTPLIKIKNLLEPEKIRHTIEYYKNDNLKPQFYQVQSESRYNIQPSIKLLTTSPTITKQYKTNTQNKDYNNNREEEIEENTSTEQFKDYDWFSPPSAFFNSKNKFEDIQNPFANPDFNFDTFIDGLRGTTTTKLTSTTTATTTKRKPSSLKSLKTQESSFTYSDNKIINNINIASPVPFSINKKIVPSLPPNEYYYYDEDGSKNMSTEKSPKKMYSSQIKPLSNENKTLSKTKVVFDDYYYDDYDYPETINDKLNKNEKNLNNITKNSEMKFSARYIEKPTKLFKNTKIPPTTYYNLLSSANPSHTQTSQKYTNDITTSTIKPTQTTRHRITKPTTAKPNREKPRQRLNTKSPSYIDHDVKRQKSSSFRVEQSSTAPISTATVTARALFNSSKYNYNNDPYYALYDDDVELYRDVDYPQQYNSATQNHGSSQQSHRRTPTPTPQTLVQEEPSKRGNTAYIKSYNSQDIYQSQSTIPDYNEDNSYNSQVDEQNSYRQQINRQPSRGDRNDLNYIEETTTKRTTTITTTRKPTTIRTTTTTSTTPRTIPTKKSTVPRLPVTANENNTQVQSNTLPEDPGKHPISISKTLILPRNSSFGLNIPTFTYRPKYSTINPQYFREPIVVVNKPAPFTLPKHLTTEKSTNFHYITKPSRSTSPVSSTESSNDHSYSNLQALASSFKNNKIIVPTTYSPPKFFLKSILPKSISSTTPNSIHFNERLYNSDNKTSKPYKTLKAVRKLINPVNLNYELGSGTTFESAERISSSFDNINNKNVLPNYKIPIRTKLINNINSESVVLETELLPNLAKYSTTDKSVTTTSSVPIIDFTSAVITDTKTANNLKQLNENNKESLPFPHQLKRFRTTVEVPPIREILDQHYKIKHEPDQLPEYKVKPFRKQFIQNTVTKTDIPQNTSSLPARVSRVNTAIKSIIAFGGPRRQNIKCHENQTANSKCNDPKQRTATRGRGSAHYSNAANIVNNEVTINVNRGTPASRSRPTLKPSTSIVSKASEFIDIYRFPATRPEPIYPQPQPDKTAAKCRKDVCLLPDCSCGGREIPGDISVEQVPQLVLLTFDDSVNDLNKGLYSDLFEKGRTNPNGCPIAATFYVSHEWTDYSQVQNLYSDGHEIASHTVSHSFGEQFSQKKWTREVAGQREILSAYGGVHLDDVRGMRAPFLSVGGNKMFKMLYDSNFTYDSSMPIYENKPPSWPYTLDYKLFHDCMIPPCPTRSYPGVWEVPMVMWQDLNGGRCSMGDACSNPPDADGVFKMLTKNFQRHYTTNRAPFGLFYHAAWFTQPHHKEGFINFLDSILEIKDVWLVTNWQAIQWIRDPTPISRLGSFQPFQCDYTNRPKRCNNPKVCNLWHKSGVRYMRTCQPCPDIYPWTGNTGIRSSRIDNDIED